MQKTLRDAGSIPGLGRSPGGGHDNPLQCSCLENPMDRIPWTEGPGGLQSIGSHRVVHDLMDLAQHRCAQHSTTKEEL